MDKSMFNRYGGFASVSKVVMSFYDKMISSPVTAKYFEDTDMKSLIDHQTQFISSIMGGPVSFTNEQLERVHKKLELSEDAFIEALDLLSDTLEEFEFENEDIRTIQNEMKSRKNFIVA